MIKSHELASAVMHTISSVERGITRPGVTVPPPPKGLCPVHLTFTSKTYCGRKLFPGSEYCYWHARINEKYKPEFVERYFGQGITLGQAIEKEVAEGHSLELAYLADAPLGGNWFQSGCDLKKGQLIRANLSGAGMSYSNLEGANLSYADLRRSYLSDCRLEGARLIGTKLFDTKFRNNNFTSVIGLQKNNFCGIRRGNLPTYRMLEQYPDQAETAYRRLALYFTSVGLIDDASWAAYRACVMRHRMLTKALDPTSRWASEAVEAMVEGKPIQLGRFQFRRFGVGWVIALWAWLRSLLQMVLMGYGEKPLRVVANSLCAILGYAGLYYMLGAISQKAFAASLYFSMVTFTTLGYGDIVPRGNLRLLAASEALVGILLCGLFLFCLGRRSVGRV